MGDLAPNKNNRSTVNRVVNRVLLVAAAVCLVSMGGTVVFAQTSVSDALYSLALNVTNATATQKDDLDVSFQLSTASLVDDGFVSSDALNAIVQKGADDIPAMPGTDRIVVKGAAQDNGGVFTDYTSQAQDAAASDVALLPAVPVVDDAFYLGFDIPASMATVDIDTAGVGTWAVTWEYYDGSSWTALDDVDDRTSAFSVLGRNIITWTVPADWSTTTIVSNEAYWIRARVSSFTSVTVQPLGSLIQYETGQWWAWVESLPLDTQEQLNLYLGGAGKLNYHQLFTGPDGIATPDAAALEPGSTFSLVLRGRAHFDTLGGNACFACKDGAIAVYPKSLGEITATVTGAAVTTTLDLSTMTLPDTGSQTVILASDGTDIALWADGGAGMAAGEAPTTVDNANAWEWASSDAVDYVDEIAYDADTGDVIDIFSSYAEWAAGTETDTQAYADALGLANGS
jgi:hypothetical protein